MLPLLLGLAFAQESPADLETRLLGPEPAAAPVVAAQPVVPAAAPVVAPAPSVTSSLDLPPWWTVPLLGLALGWAWTQRRRTEKVEADAMRVLGRTPVGKDAAVVLLEVRDASGAWRRLLVGHGAQGPQLITGLGASQVVSVPAPVAAPTPARRGFAAFMDQEEQAHDSLPEVPAYPVVEAPKAEPPPKTMVTSWFRDDGADEVDLSPRPVLGPAGALAAAIHGRVPRNPEVRTEPPPVHTEPPPVRTEPPPQRRSAEEGMVLRAEVRRAKGRIGTRVQAYG